MYHWEVVEAMFKEYPLVKQHIDSYNEFVNNKIHKILDDINSQANKQGEKVEIRFHKIRLEKPVVTEADGSKRDLTPMEARMRDRTYSAPIFVEMSIFEEGKEIDRDEVYIGELPVMIKSDLCALRGLSGDDLVSKGEDPLDQGGYFVINGTERVLISQEEMAPNRVRVVRSKKGGKEYVTGEIHSYGGSIRARIKVERKDDGMIYIELPSVSSKNLNAFAVLKALGFDTKQKLTKAFSENPEVVNDILLNLEDLEIKDEEDALDYIGKRTAAGQPEEYRKNRAAYILDNYLFPHIGLKPEDRKKKGYFLVKMIERSIEVAKGMREEDDKDHYANKRVKISGKLIEELFIYSMNYFMKDLKYQIERANTRGRKMQLKTLVRPDALNDRIKFAMGTGTWVYQKSGVSQILDRTTHISAVSELRRVNSPLKHNQPHFEARDLHPTHLGKICTHESPEGQRVGLNKHMAIGCFVSSKETPENVVEKEFEGLGLKLIKK